MTKEAILRIPAIHCDGCATSITRVLKMLPGVGETGVDAKAKLARFTFDDSQVSLDQIREALDEVGFSPED